MKQTDINDGAPYPLPNWLDITIAVGLFLVSFALTGCLLYGVIMLVRWLAGAL